ncbi:lactate utilization protein C [Bacillus methanolicus]|uniref:LutC/YkgG family protein n=1 Tax=Bacillus methanolicus TaxID=1471 RepID=UPI002380A623|nr:lactate utilization protein C [Bacillus methanolicus]MDE3838256.1 lactate utilization protein C [Bacillus methanolicus]
MQGSIQNRETFLANIANRLGREPKISGVKKPHWLYTPQHSILKNASQDELLEVLKAQCMNIHTNFVVTDLTQLSIKLREAVYEYGGGPIVASKDSRFDQYGLSLLLREGFPNEEIDVHFWDYSIGDENIKIADQANVGIIISDITLAESGTVVLFSSKDKGRTLNFLPTNFIAIVPKSTIVPRMTQAARIMREKVLNGEQIASCVNFITGPSNSADIEMNLVVGVHGPVKATYIVVEDV